MPLMALLPKDLSSTKIWQTIDLGKLKQQRKCILQIATILRPTARNAHIYCVSN